MMITVETLINKNIQKVWDNWINPEAIIKWNHASDDWHCPKAVNNFEVGKNFSYTMSSVDGKNSFEFEGMYAKIEPLKNIETILGDGRRVSVSFELVDNENTIVTESFETENENSVDQQREGWQAILENFRKYCEITA